MIRALFILFLSLLCARANLTNLVRETFSGYGTNTSSITGAFNVVAGTWNRRPVGPRLAGDTTAASLGWSARMDGGTGGASAFMVTNAWPAAQSNGCAEAWYYVTESTGGGRMLTLINTVGNNVVALSTTSTNRVIFTSQVGPPFSGTLDQLETNKWYCFTIEWHNTNPTSLHDVRVYRRAIDELTPTLIQAWTNKDANGRIAQVTFYGATGGTMWKGRIGMPSLYATANIGDAATATTDYIAPPTAPVTWFVNPSTGNDTNTGVTPSEAWASARKISEESLNPGMLPRPGSFTNGNMLVIDTSASVLPIAATNINLATDGLNVKPTNGTYITMQCHQVLTNSQFTKTASWTNIWQTTDTATDIVAWEDDKWLSHPTGANFAAVAGLMDTNPGSFYTDGTTLYIHPFGNTAPTNDSKAYTRANYNSAAIQLLAPNMNVRGFYAGKTALARKTDNDALGGYIIGTGAAFGGTSIISDCFLFYAAKHALGLVADASNSEITISNVVAEQCPPYSGSSATPFVSFMSSATATNNLHRYVNCVTTNNIGLIGSTAGMVDVQSVLYMHNLGSGIQWRHIIVDSCRIPNIGISVCSNALVSNSVVGIATMTASVTNIFVRNRFTGYPTGCGVNTSTNCYIANNLFLPTNGVQAGQSGLSSSSGNSIWENNTIDLRNVPSGDATNRGFLLRNGASTILFRNNAILVAPGSKQWTVFENFSGTADTLTLSNNVYSLGSSNWIAHNYTNAGASDRTFAQWQALGFDANSASVSDARLNATTYVPLGDSPVRDFGVSQGVAQDFTGNTFANRNDAGAVEYRRPRGFRGFR